MHAAHLYAGFDPKSGELSIVQDCQTTTVVTEREGRTCPEHGS